MCQNILEMENEVQCLKRRNSNPKYTVSKTCQKLIHQENGFRPLLHYTSKSFLMRFLRSMPYLLIYITKDNLLRKALMLTSLFTNMRILKFRSQQTIAFFAAVNHLNRPLRKQNFTSRGSKGHGLWCVDFDPFCVFLCFKVPCLWS